MIQRKMQNIIENNLFDGKILLLFGPRQVGKTTLVKEILKKYPEESSYYDCLDPFFNEKFSGKSISEFQHIIQGKKILVLDEAQSVRNIGVTLKLLHDHFPKLQIIATGSSSFELANMVNEPLTGRKRTFCLYPLSVSEIVQDSSSMAIQAQIPHFLRYGMYPDIFQASEEKKEQDLRELTSSYLFKDILTFENIKKPDLLMRLLQALALQIGSEVSYTELANLLRVDQATVQHYIDLLEKIFVIFRLPALHRNLRKEIVKSRKIYFYDTGIRNALLNNFNPLEIRNDTGGLWENFMIVERMKFLEYSGGYKNRYFWRTYDQKEVDYIEESGGKFDAFEFKWGTKKYPKPPKQFLEAYPGSSFSVIDPENYGSFLE